MTSFQKTIEEDLSHRQNNKGQNESPEGSVVEHLQNEQGFQQVSYIENEKPPLATFSYKNPIQSSQNVELVPQKKSESQARLSRSTSSKASFKLKSYSLIGLNVSANQEQKSENQAKSNKKEHLQRSLTEESRRDTQTEDKEQLRNENKGSKLQMEQYVIAKFDYNAQKVYKS